MAPTSSRCRRRHRVVEDCPDCPSLISAIQRKTWKLRDGEPVWPPDVEAAFLEGLQAYRPSSTTDPLQLQRFPKRNRFIAEFIFKKTATTRSAKQVGSRLQQLRDTCPDKKIKALISNKDWSSRANQSDAAASNGSRRPAYTSPTRRSKQGSNAVYTHSPTRSSPGTMQRYRFSEEDHSKAPSPPMYDSGLVTHTSLVNGWSESHSPPGPIHSAQQHTYASSEDMFQAISNVAGPVMDGAMYGHQFDDIQNSQAEVQQLPASDSAPYTMYEQQFDNVQQAPCAAPNLFIDTSLLPPYGSVSWPDDPRTGDSMLYSSESSHSASPQCGSGFGSPASHSNLSEGDVSVMQTYTQYSPTFYAHAQPSSWAGLEALENSIDESLYPVYPLATWEPIHWQSTQGVKL